MADYKFTQQSGSGWKVDTSDKADAYQDTNELRAIVDELGRLLGHSKKNGAFPEDGTSGGYITQIAFPATQVPSAGVNTLDDYEEGEWTPALEFGGASVGMTYSIQSGLYTKIGRQVTVTGYIYLSAKGTSEGNAQITGLPFTAKNADGAYSAASLRMVKITFANVYQAQVLKNATVIALNEIIEDGTVTQLTDVNFANDSNTMFSATYFTE